MVPLKKIPARVAKYDVQLREGAVRAAQAAHAILSRMVLFTCRECSERFPTFHPAYAPPECIARNMEVLKRGRDGLASCSVEVFWWEELPPLQPPDGLALQCSGVCVRCHKDMLEQMASNKSAANLGEFVGLRSVENHMDPCFRFPADDLRELFDGATIVEAMLVALEHMQINFVTISHSQLRKFKRNIISFPQEVSSFVAKLGLMRNYRPGDRVNSVRGFGFDAAVPDRPARRVVDASDEDREKYAHDSGGCLIFPATVLERRPDGLLVLEYDGGGQGREKSENVHPRLAMPWSPSDVPLHVMLRRNLGRGKGALEGLQVRWFVVANLLQALTSLPPNGQCWRLGGREDEPMHKYYDPQLFPMRTTEERLSEVRARYAPKERGGVLLSSDEVAQLSFSEKVQSAVDVTSVEHFISAGFDVHFVGPEVELSSSTCADSGDVDSSIVDDNGLFYVDEQTFRIWLEVNEFPLSQCVQQWWVQLPSCQEGSLGGLKCEDDETVIDLFRRIRDGVRDSDDAVVSSENSKCRAVKDGNISLVALVQWLRESNALPEEMVNVSESVVLDDFLHELNVALFMRGADIEDKGCVDTPVDCPEEDKEAQQTAERLVYGWPSQNSDPVAAHAIGRFVRSFPLDFPMGIADLYEVRPRTVSAEVWVQHLLRYRTGHFVGGARGQRVLWAMVNTLLLTEARSRGFAVYRNVIRRVGVGLEGGRVLTKGALKAILKTEGSMRVLVGQLSTVGRDVRSTTMQWSYEGKKLDCTVKHLSWVPPWVDALVEGQPPMGRQFLSQEHIVPDVVGLGKHPSMWWTMNCHYNAAYDVQRLNVRSDTGDASLDAHLLGDRRERCGFTRDNADLVAFQMTLRTELMMGIVMRAVVRHSEQWPLLSMARFETGPNGNPHFHGFSAGLPPPILKRVVADVSGEDDVAPMSSFGDFELMLSAIEKGEVEWLPGDLIFQEHAEQCVERVLAGEEKQVCDDSIIFVSDDEDEGAHVLSPSAVPGLLLRQRVSAVMAVLLEAGVLEEVRADDSCEEGLSISYRLLSAPSGHVRPAYCVGKSKRPNVKLEELEKDGAGLRAVGDFGVVRPPRVDEQSQSFMEREFAKFFEGMVSEWNPCYSDDGCWRYKWDEEIQAHDVEAEVGISGCDASLSSEARAQADVTPVGPERMNLRGLLDKVYEQAAASAVIDLQPVRRLVAALVHRVARHTKHGVLPPKFTDACARGKESCPYCRYGFPRDRIPRHGSRTMVMEKGDREGQWHAHFPRNDRLCCSYEAHILLANMGNIDWRPVLNLWAIVQYVTKYATKAPKGSRGLREVLDDAIEEVCTYVPEGEGADYLRRSIQKFFARTLGERDYHAYEAVQLGLNLPMVIPLMPVVSLNIAGARLLKSYQTLKDADEDAPVHYDSRVDKFNKRLHLVRKQRGMGDESITEDEVRHVSLYEFWWKFVVYRGRVKRSSGPVCLMVTPHFSADCANVEHASHESYARMAVIAYWRHMSTVERHRQIDAVMQVGSLDRICSGATAFVDPPAVAGAPLEDRFLGIRDLYVKFERGTDDCWGLGLLEMLVDPMLSQWVPSWLIEQYDRCNPFFREVLASLVSMVSDGKIKRNRMLLRATRREMIRRHHRQLARKDQADKHVGSGSDHDKDDDDDVDSNDGVADVEHDGLVGAVQNELGDCDAQRQDSVNIIREPLPQVGGVGDAEESDPAWALRTAAERLSAAEPAPAAPDRQIGLSDDKDVAAGGGGSLWNPSASLFDWLGDPSNVPEHEFVRLERLCREWYGKALVGDGADAVSPEELDPWQRFAHDIVMDSRHDMSSPLRLMLAGSAGTGKSRTVRAFVGSRRERTRQALEAASVSAEQSRARSAPASRKATDRHAAVEEAIRNCCLLAAPTGCASFQLRYGAATLHRAFGVPVHYCGPWLPGQRASVQNGKPTRYGRLLKRLVQAKLFLMDEVSMIGRQMMGKIDFKIDDTLRNDEEYKPFSGASVLGARDCVLAGDMKQAPPIGDEPLYKEGAYVGKGQNKPRGADRTPTGALDSRGLVARGVTVRDSFHDVVILRQVWRHSSSNKSLSPERQEAYRRDAAEFLEIMRGLADCTWTIKQHMWLSRRNRSVLQQTVEGREELKAFADAPLLMDGRKDRVTGEVGANRINRMHLEELSRKTKQPILVLRAYHNIPDTPEGKQLKPEQMDDEEFRGIQREVLVCVGARVLLTQNLWVEAGLMNGAMGTVRGYCWPRGGDPRSEDSRLRSPLCVFVEFDSVNLKDERGHVRSFFPNDPEKSLWVPIMRQQVSASAEDHVSRANFPLTLAWALTHWKAQGMILERVRVHLSARTAALPGIGFVACTRVRHPWDLVFQEDLPEYQDFMRVRRTPAFRMRCRFELKQLARASKTLRRYGYCKADYWTPLERDAAAELLQGLFVGPRAEQKHRVMRDGRNLHDDNWLWGTDEPDYLAELQTQARLLAAGDAAREQFLLRVVRRLLDDMHVRVATPLEEEMASKLLAAVDVSLLDYEDAFRAVVLQNVPAVASLCDVSMEESEMLAKRLLIRIRFFGNWDGYVDDDEVPEFMKPLHMPAVKESLGALIPAWLDKGLDKAAQKSKVDYSEVTVGSTLCMDSWRVNVRSEEMLARGRLNEDVLDFFRKVLNDIVTRLDFPISIGSVTVGKAVGMQESPARLCRVMESWKQAFDRAQVRRSEQLFLPVAIDEERKPAQDWFLLVVSSTVSNQTLGKAERLCLHFYDPAQRSGFASMQRVIRNVACLVQGADVDSGRQSPEVEWHQVPTPEVGSQRILLALALLLHRVCSVAKQWDVDMPVLDCQSDSFIPDASHVLRGVFAYFRDEVASSAVRDVCKLLCKERSCWKVLRMFGTVPSLTRRAETLSSAPSGICSGSSVVDRPDENLQLQLVRVATWNVAGGHKSAQAPSTYNDQDQRARVLAEILRWHRTFGGCDVICLQECESVAAYAQLLSSHEFVGEAVATANRGYIHIYVRRGLQFRRISSEGSSPLVAVQVFVERPRAEPLAFVVVACHFPAGDRASVRQRLLKEACALTELQDRFRLLLVGDMNAKDEEVASWCEDRAMREAKYVGVSWGARGNGFYADSSYAGFGIRKDRALFGQGLWAEAHLVGQGKEFFDGAEFNLSDHFGVMVYVDNAECYEAITKKSEMVRRLHRKRLADLRERFQQLELVENKARRLAGREQQAVERRRVAERDRADFQKGIRRAADQRRDRGIALKSSAFGVESLFANSVAPLLPAYAQAVQGGIPSSPAELGISAFDATSRGSWAVTAGVPLRGLHNVSNTCYLLSVCQLLIRTPCVLPWLIRHHEDNCPNEQACCVVCALFLTYTQIYAGWASGSAPVPILAARRAQVHAQFDGAAHHDAAEFLLMFLDRAREREIESMRISAWLGLICPDAQVATHVDRLFAFVLETRAQCTICKGAVRTFFERCCLLQLKPVYAAGGPLSVSELYWQFCSAASDSNEEQICPNCQQQTVHRKQSRMITCPNVLLIEIKRDPNVQDQPPVAVEEQVQFDVPGMPLMDLMGVVYHRPAGVSHGHYMSLCRGPEGGFWFYDDDRPVRRETGELAHVRPRQTKLISYVRPGGVAEWSTSQGDDLVLPVEGSVVSAPSGALCNSSVRWPCKTSVNDSSSSSFGTHFGSLPGCEGGRGAAVSHDSGCLAVGCSDVGRGAGKDVPVSASVYRRVERKTNSELLQGDVMDVRGEVLVDDSAGRGGRCDSQPVSGAEVVAVDVPPSAMNNGRGNKRKPSLFSSVSTRSSLRRASRQSSLDAHSHSNSEVSMHGVLGRSSKQSKKI